MLWLLVADLEELVPAVEEVQGDIKLGPLQFHHLLEFIQ
jgi:hypothetical protein